MQFASVKKIKDLHHNECVEDEGEVPRVNPVSLQNSFVVLITIVFIKSSAAYSTSNYSIVPLILGMCCKDAVVVGVLILRDEALSCEYEYEHHNDLKNALADDMFEHGFGYDVFVSGVRMPFQKTVLWIFGS